MATTTPLTYILKLCQDGWIELTWRADPDLFRVILAGVKAIPAQRRDYDPARRVWRIASVGLLLDLGVYLPGLVQRVEALMDGAEPRTVTPAMPPAVTAAYGEMWLVPGCPWQLVQPVYKQLALLHHPDRPGGATLPA